MVYAAGSKRASLVGVAGIVPELDHMLAVQRFAPQLQGVAGIVGRFRRALGAGCAAGPATVRVRRLDGRAEGIATSAAI